MIDCSRIPPTSRGRPIGTQAQSPALRPALSQPLTRDLRWPSLQYVGGVVLLAAAYYGSAKLGQALRYTGSVSAIWPPVGIGIAALYLWGIRWWPGVLLGEILVTGELLLDRTIPIGSLLGQQTGNVAEIIVGALLLRRLIGRDAAMDRVGQVGGMLVALGVATAISATVGTVSMVLGGVVTGSDAPEFWRTWWLGDTSGGLVVIPLMLAWAYPIGVWRCVRSWEGAATAACVIALSVVAFSTTEPIRYTVFPALIWAAFRFGPPGATLSIAITAGVAIGLTANDVGPFIQQPVTDRTLDTQLYIWVVALTTLFLSAVLSERQRSARELAEARRTEGARAVEERHRIARELHDSVSQALFSTVLHTRTAQKALVEEGGSPSGRVGQSLAAIADLTKSMQSEMRALIFELHRDPLHDGLIAALARHASDARTSDGLTIDVRAPGPRLALPKLIETQLFAIGREALTNVQRHAGASAAHVRVEAQQGHVALEVRDNGRGFNPAFGHPGHFGLDSMRTRAAEIGGQITITSAPGTGTLVRVCVPVETDSN